MAGRQDPPGKSGVMIAIGVPKPDGKNGRMAPPGGDRPGAAGKAKMSPEEAGVIREDEHCIDCSMYDPQQGTCSIVAGQLAPADSCDYFEAISGDKEPDADDQGGPSDQDSDDDDGGGQAA